MIRNATRMRVWVDAAAARAVTETASPAMKMAGARNVWNDMKRMWVAARLVVLCARMDIRSGLIVIVQVNVYMKADRNAVTTNASLPATSEMATMTAAMEVTKRTPHFNAPAVGG